MRKAQVLIFKLLIVPHSSANYDLISVYLLLFIDVARDVVEWLKKEKHGNRSYWDILIHPEKGLNAGTRYESRPVGNSPELMPLDCCLFADLTRSLRMHARITSSLDKDNKNKFSLSTPLNVSLSIHRLWAPSNEADGGVPSSSRIIQDITKCSGTHLLQIIEARGALVEGIGNRNGVRKRTMGNWGGPREKKPMASKIWVHPDARKSRDEATAASVKIALDEILQIDKLLEDLTNLKL